MDNFTTRFRFLSVLLWVRRLTVGVLLMATGAVVCYGVLRWSGAIAPAIKDAVAADKPSDANEENAVVKMPQEKWAAAGIRIEPARYAPFKESVWRGGRLALDETRIAHIFPMAEGVIREVKIRLGQDVRAGEVLAVIDSREVGQAKLDLVKSRLAASYARAQHAWTQLVNSAAVEMVKVMATGAKVTEIENQFKDRPIGDLRQQLMTAYSRRLQAKSHYEAVMQGDARGSMPQATVIRLRSDYEAAEATYRALCEEVSFQAAQQTRASEQKLRETQTAEALSKATLLMLGYSTKEVEQMDPIAEGSSVSLYPVHAPFSGTVIEQHAVLSERVGPQHQMFQIADLSTLWLKAEIPQKDLPLLQGLTGSKVRFRTMEGTDSTQQATVFYTGDVVDKDTRTIALTATVPNPDRKLKAGVFVEVELIRNGAEVVQLPASAIQRQGTQPFVFVHVGGDEFHRVDVQLGRESGGLVEIVGGLKSGQSVVVAGAFVLKSEMLKDLMAGD